MSVQDRLRELTKRADRGEPLVDEAPLGPWGPPSADIAPTEAELAVLKDVEGSLAEQREEIAATVEDIADQRTVQQYRAWLAEQGKAQKEWRARIAKLGIVRDRQLQAAREEHAVALERRIPLRREIAAWKAEVAGKLEELRRLWRRVEHFNLSISRVNESIAARGIAAEIYVEWAGAERDLLPRIRAEARMDKRLFKALDEIRDSQGCFFER